MWVYVKVNRIVFRTSTALLWRHTYGLFAMLFALRTAFMHAAAVYSVEQCQSFIAYFHDFLADDRPRSKYQKKVVAFAFSFSFFGGKGNKASF